MKILHTADWHLGQLFHEYDRTFEHSRFLRWLINTAHTLEIDAMLISGDVFDVSNPSAVSTSLYYNFLREITHALPKLQIVITAGNHDSATRLESPRALLEAFNVTVLGLIPRKEDNTVDYEKLIIPLRNKSGVRKAWCMAIPFLRMGDYPTIENATQPYSEGVCQFYSESYKFALSKQENGEAIITMGHLHCLNAETSANDKSERAIMGGIEFVSSSAFHPDIAYIALGHIHKAQRVGGRENVRYSGSPIPMSFSELNYKHQVVVFDIENGIADNIQAIEIPVTVELLRIPAKPKSFSDVLMELDFLPEANPEKQLAPYLEVRVLLDGPEPSLRHKIEAAIENKQVRLTRIEVSYNKADEAESSNQTFTDLRQINPLDMLSKTYLKKYNSEVPAELVSLFNEVSAEVG